jgi:prepilin-type N-terminal cleavage/methylation domain-containing protein
MKISEAAGFTIIELIITLAIVAILFGTAYMYMSGYIPKQRLNSDTSNLTNLLKLTQSYAITKGAKHGIIFKKNGDIYLACGFRDTNGDWQCTNCTCTNCSCPNSEMLGQRSLTFRDSISILNCAGTKAVAENSPRDTIIFDFKGYAYLKSAAPPSAGVTDNFEIFLKSSELSTGSAVKEIEVLSSGIIENSKLGQAGDIPGIANVIGCD